MNRKKNIFGNFQIIPKDKRGGVLELEKKYDIILPPIFKAFCEIFALTSIVPSNNHYLLYEDEEVGFEEFEQSIEELMIVYIEQGDNYQKDKMLPIATSGIHSGGVCLGLEGENQDKIFVDNEVYDGRFQPIASNILDFIDKLYEVHFDDV